MEWINGYIVNYTMETKVNEIPGDSTPMECEQTI